MEKARKIAERKAAERRLVEAAKADERFVREGESGTSKCSCASDEFVYEAAGDGCSDETGECGEGSGWYGLLVFGDKTPLVVEHEEGGIETRAGAILREDNQGFVEVETYKTEKEAREAWDELLESEAQNAGE